MLHTLAPRLACVDGALAELGVYQGDLAWQMNLVFPERPLHLFDTFSGFPAQDLAAEPFSHTQGKLDFSDTTAADVLARLPHPEQAIVHAGYFPDTADAALGPFALVSVDADLYAPTLAALDYFLPRMSPGGMLLLHDYANPRFAGVAAAVRDHEASHGPLALVPLPDLHGTAIIIVQE